MSGRVVTRYSPFLDLCESLELDALISLWGLMARRWCLGRIRLGLHGFCRWHYWSDCRGHCRRLRHLVTVNRHSSSGPAPHRLIVPAGYQYLQSPALGLGSPPVPTRSPRGSACRYRGSRGGCRGKARSRPGRQPLTLGIHFRSTVTEDAKLGIWNQPPAT